MTQTTAETKLANFVKLTIAPAIEEFIADLTDNELRELIAKFRAMNIDLTKDLTKAAKERKILSAQWTEDSPFDDLFGDGIK